MLLQELLYEPRVAQSFLLLQSTAAQTSLPLLRNLLKQSSSSSIVFSFLYPPSSLVAKDASTSSTTIYDWTANVPGYGDLKDIKHEVLQAVKNGHQTKPLNIVIDSLETLNEDITSITETYALLREILEQLQNYPTPSRLIIHSVKPSDTATVLLQTEFSSSLVHLTAHPTALFHHLAKDFMIYPPPITPDAKFWNIFIALSDRMDEIEKLSFGNQGEGTGSTFELVVEVLTRGLNSHSRKRGVERVLEGWDCTRGVPCELKDLQDFRSLFSKKQTLETVVDPTQNLSFNLNLSASQQQSRAQVPLPYAHEGRPVDATASAGTILYDPDSADDLDEDDPDEDLDI